MAEAYRCDWCGMYGLTKESCWRRILPMGAGSASDPCGRDWCGLCDPRETQFEEKAQAERDAYPRTDTSDRDKI